MTPRTRTPHWCEEIVAECPNCGVEVVLIRFDDEDIATGYCTACATVVVQDLYETVVEQDLYEQEGGR